MTTPSLPYNRTSVVIRRVFMASRQRVFHAWIRPEALESWLRPGGKSLTVSKLDAQVGGSFCLDLEDGTSIVGTYLNIIPPEKLVFTWVGRVTQGRETIVTLDFLDQGRETEVVLTHEKLDSLEMSPLLFGSGWQTMFDGLEELFIIQH